MASAPSDTPTVPRTPAVPRPVQLKIVIAGPFGVGKTTLVGVASETAALTTEETLTQAGAVVDDLTGVRSKTTTTVGIDFGRLTLRAADPAHPGVVLFLIGAPGQARFRALWDELTYGALGVLVLADTRRFDASFDVLDLVEVRGLPYAVAVNQFDDSPIHTPAELRSALDLADRTPLTTLDARDRASTRDALITLVEHIKEQVLSS
ncbi:GTP-binding protein [Streptomyces sp. NPDC087851]|uniref:GTP-binding protein n=1 Tax=Streptomyces sp. NPDC087851 TaxID=3365810 RepID=UPI00382B6A5B